MTIIAIKVATVACIIVTKVDKTYQSNMKLAKTRNTQYHSLYCVHCCLLLLMITSSVSLMLTGEGYDHDGNSGSGNDSCVEAELIDCQCNATNLTLNKRFLLTWLNFAEHHSISKMMIEVHKLKDVTNNLEVSEFCSS